MPKERLAGWGELHKCEHMCFMYYKVAGVPAGGRLAQGHRQCTVSGLAGVVTRGVRRHTCESWRVPQPPSSPSSRYTTMPSSSAAAAVLPMMTVRG